MWDVDWEKTKTRFRLAEPGSIPKEDFDDA